MWLVSVMDVGDIHPDRDCNISLYRGDMCIRLDWRNMETNIIFALAKIASGRCLQPASHTKYIQIADCWSMNRNPIVYVIIVLVRLEVQGPLFCRQLWPAHLKCLSVQGNLHCSSLSRGLCCYSCLLFAPAYAIPLCTRTARNFERGWDSVKVPRHWTSAC